MACSHCKRLGHYRTTCPKLAARKKSVRKGDTLTDKQKAALALGPKSPNIGKPKDNRDVALFSDLDNAPDDPLERVVWAQEIECRLLAAFLRDEIPSKRLETARRLIDSIVKTVPRERLFRAEQAIRNDRLKKKPKASGPTTEAVRPSDGPLR